MQLCDVSSRVQPTTDYRERRIQAITSLSSTSDFNSGLALSDLLPERGSSHLEEVVEGEEKGLDVNEILLEDIRNSGCHDAKSEMM